MEFKRIKMVYFSPTKTTKTVLEGIAKHMGVDEVEEFDLTYSSEQPIKAYEDELVIIGAPVYAGRLPVEAVERFKKLQANNTLAIIVVVYGNREYDDALLELKNLVIELGCIPIAGGAFIGEHSFSTEEFPIGGGRPDSLDIQKTKEFAQEIKEKIKTLSIPKMQIGLEVPGNFPYKDAMPPNKVAPVTDESLCALCGECVDICPTGAIFLDESIKTDIQLCVRCCACVKSCPSGARVIEDSMWKAIGVKLNTNCSERKEPQFFL